MSKQLLRSGTSIGANISEALCAQSRKDFYAKMLSAITKTQKYPKSQQCFEKATANY